ncbi:ATP-binding cassette sub-family C member 4-like isoform X2 [Oculina patagonica]
MATEYDRLEAEPIHKDNPKKHANIFSILSFWWVGQLLAIGNKRPLENDDLFSLLDEDKTQTSTEKLQRTWNEETTGRASNKSGSKGYRLLKAIIRAFPCTDYMFILTVGLLPGVCNVLQPVFLSLLLPELMKPSLEESWWAYVYAAGICLSSFVRAICAHQFGFHSRILALRWKSATIGIVYKKVLCLRQADIANVTSGYVINLIASDLQRFENTVIGIGLIIQALFEMCCISLLMFYLFGWKPLSGVMFLVTLTVYYGMMGRVCATLRSKISKVADERVDIMNSIISGIRTVKMYAWEWPFMERVQGIRRQEIKLIRWKTAILATFSSLQYTCTPIAAFISLVTLATTGTELTSYNTFMILSLISTLRLSVSWNISQNVNVLADFATALNRIQGLLEYNSDNIHQYLQDTFAKSRNDECNNTRFAKSINCGGFDELAGNHMHSHKDPVIVLENVVCSWTGNRNKPTLKSLCLTVNKGDLIFITGRVGCGKSSLLYSFLREIPVINGETSCVGKIAWVSQQPWVFSGTVRDNILFGEPFDPERYRMALQACDLNKDLLRFPDGDMTVVGERGIVLSGGQQARVELARAVYSNADIYLLDDPLSAVDSKVGHHIFNTCINGLLQDKTRLMITHNLEVLRDAKHIVAMKEGSILARGDFPSLRSTGFDLDVIDQSVGEKPVPMQMEKQIIQDILANEKNSEEEFARLEIAEEDRVIGSVSWNLYWHFIQAGMHCILAVAMVTFFFIVQGWFMDFAKRFFTFLFNFFFPLISTISGTLILPDWWLLHLTSRSHDRQHQVEDLYIYGSLVAGALLLSIIRAAVFFNALINSSKRLHDSMLSAVLKATVLFFDTNPVGRVLNRFSRDIGIMDELLPDVFLDAVQIILFCIGAIVFPSILNPWVILPATPLMIIFILIGRYYLTTSRDLRRLEGINRSPVLSHFSDTLMGVVTIRAYKREDDFLKALYRYQDDHNRTWFSILSTMRWIGVRLDVICVFFVAFVVFLAIATKSGSGITALSLVYTLQLAVDTSQYGVRQCSEVENYMTSVERVITYAHIEQEPGYECHHQPPNGWPEHGRVQLKNLGLVYYEGAPEILKNVSFTVDSHEKIGIVGRTGAGKSSLVSALFRMPQPTGHVIIDGVDISDINIQSSRRAMSVITQNPVLFNGSLRLNLDPFEEYEDKELWDALEEASLKSTVKKLPQQLGEDIKESGANFSVGERQLLCLARALLKKDKIIVMDEATANVDYKTDQLIQETIRTKFQHCTVMTIAHRLNTIIDYDRVLVLENGQIVEYDKPERLLQNKGGQFSILYHGYDTDTY